MRLLYIRFGEWILPGGLDATETRCTDREFYCRMFVLLMLTPLWLPFRLWYGPMSELRDEGKSR